VSTSGFGASRRAGAVSGRGKRGKLLPLPSVGKVGVHGEAAQRGHEPMTVSLRLVARELRLELSGLRRNIRFVGRVPHHVVDGTLDFLVREKLAQAKALCVLRPSAVKLAPLLYSVVQSTG
jgi:hypothetical protein